MRVLALSIIVVLLGCAVDPAIAPRDCTPGQTAACACPGASGVQACDEGGVLGACVCPDAGSAPDVVPVDRSAPDVVRVVEDRPAPQPDVVDAGSAPDVVQLPDVVVPDVPRTCPGVDLMRDVMNCGACGNVCPTWPNATPSWCSLGTCVSGACVRGFLGCDSNPFNGCEVNINTDRRNCGRCRHECGPSQTCRDGVCR